MSWITSDWRLKLLALGLAALMLGAVAFSQNPPTNKQVTTNINYTVPAGLTVVNPPSKTTVTVSGLADTISGVTPVSVVATVDLTKAGPGPSVNVNVVVKSLVPGVSIQPVPPIALDIEKMASVRLPVVVRTPRVTPGWQVTQAVASCPSSPCFVTFDGPVSLESNLKAYADFTSPVQNNSYDVLTQDVVLEQNGVPLDLAHLASTTVPKAGLDLSSVSIHIDAKTGTTTRQVSLIDAPPSNPPPTCYRITGIAIDPLAVTISGSPEALSQITTITLPAIDLSRSTSNATFKVTIPYPAGITGSAATARVTYSIAQNPNCSSPSP